MQEAVRRLGYGATKGPGGLRLPGLRLPGSATKDWKVRLSKERVRIEAQVEAAYRAYGGALGLSENELIWALGQVRALGGAGMWRDVT